MHRVLVVLLCAIAIVLGGCDMPNIGGEEDKSQTEVVPKSLEEYSWAELSQVSAQISAAPDDEQGREVARQFGLVNEDGSLSSATKMIVLDNTRALDVRLAGIRHDDKADGSGKAGLTFMTVGAVDIRPMNDDETVDGGWEASALRAWLASDLVARLDKDLADALVPVNKLTNNVGITDDPGCVTPTADKVWLFSVHEVCGDVAWDVDEFLQMRGYEDVDGIVNSEGSQYEAFAQAGVNGEGDAHEWLSLADSTGPSSWWYRTPYPFDWVDYGNTGANGYFYRVMDSGYPKSLGAPQDLSAVVVGFCV